jgi:hypothetical protein
MGAAVDDVILLHTMAYYPAPAVLTIWSKHLNRAFETVECVGFGGNRDLESLVVFISALVTSSHWFSSDLNFAATSATGAA